MDIWSVSYIPEREIFLNWDNKAFEIIKSSGLYAENKFIENILTRKDIPTEEELKKIQETSSI